MNRLAALAITLGLVLIGCGQPIAPELGLEPIEHPDLSTIEEAARRQIDGQRSRLDDLLATSEDRLELAGALGGLGEVYHAYDLLAPAAACYRNAALADGDSFLWPYYLGVLLAAEGDNAGARRELERALELRADDPAASIHLADTLLALGESEAAHALYLPLIEEPGFTAAAHYGLGRLALEGNHGAEGRDHFEAALAAQGDAGVIRHALGLAHRQLGELERAQELLSQENSGEVSFPDRPMERVAELAISSGALLKRGNQALVAGDLGRAADAFRDAIEANPESSEAYRNLALTLARQNDLDGGLEVLREAAERFPDNVWIHFDLGTTYMGKGLAEQGVEAFRQAIELSPDLAKARFNLANALIGLDRWDEATPHLEKVLALEPDNERAAYLAAMSLHRQGSSPQAIRRLERLLARDPDSLVVRRGLADILAERGRIPRALEIYREGLRQTLADNEKAQLLNQIAELAWRARRRDEAITAWRQAVEEVPDSSAAHTALGNGLQLIGRRAEAREHFAHAVELDPTNATAWLSEASLWILDKEVKTARDRLNEALEHVPDHAGLVHTLARLLATSADIGVRDGARALELARRAYNIERNLDHAETLAMALAENEQFEEAIQWQRRLINQMGPASGRAALQRLVANLQRYENRQPVRVN